MYILRKETREGSVIEFTIIKAKNNEIPNNEILLLNLGKILVIDNIYKVEIGFADDDFAKDLATLIVHTNPIKRSNDEVEVTDYRRCRCLFTNNIQETWK